MLSLAEKAVLEDLRLTLVRRFGDRLAGLSLFGSRARGEGRDDSDLDLLVEIVDLTRLERGEILDRAADLGVDHDLVLSPLVLPAGQRALHAHLFAGAVPL